MTIIKILVIALTALFVAENAQAGWSTGGYAGGGGPAGPAGAPPPDDCGNDGCLD